MMYLFFTKIKAALPAKMIYELFFSFSGNFAERRMFFSFNDEVYE